MNKKLKNGIFILGLIGIGFQMACGDPLKELVTDDEQLIVDIEDMENYLLEKGYTGYDTLEDDIRILILEEGDGDDIEFGDIVQYDFVGRYLDDLIFDATLAELVFKQDTTFADTISFELDSSDEFVLDVNGWPSLEYIEFEEDYFSAYSPFLEYSPYVTTHSPNGWFIRTEGVLAEGFETGVHYALSNLKLGGKLLLILPSHVGSDRIPISQNFSFSDVYGAQPLVFEIQPLRKR